MPDSLERFMCMSSLGNLQVYCLLKIVTYHQVLSVDGWVEQCSLLLMAQDLTTKGHKDLMSWLDSVHHNESNDNKMSTHSNRVKTNL